MRLYKYFKILVLLILSISIIIGCNSKNKESTENTKVPPKSLNKIEENIDKIINTLDQEAKLEPSKETSENKEQQNSNQEENLNQEEKSENKKGNEESSDKNQSSSNFQEKEQPQKSPWNNVEDIIKELHKDWNEYQPIAIKDGSDLKLINEFNKNLNILTNDIIDKNIMSTLNNSNNLYKFIPEFFSNYGGKNIALKKLKFYTRDVMYKSRYEKWDLAYKSIDDAVNIMPTIKSQSNDKLKDMFETLKYSVTNMQDVVMQKEQKLTQIKGNIVLENIKNMENIIKQQKEVKK